jgi:hypothetical protein
VRLRFRGVLPCGVRRGTHSYARAIQPSCTARRVGTRATFVTARESGRRSDAGAFSRNDMNCAAVFCFLCKAYGRGAGRCGGAPGVRAGGGAGWVWGGLRRAVGQTPDRGRQHTLNVHNALFSFSGAGRVHVCTPHWHPRHPTVRATHGCAWSPPHVSGREADRDGRSADARAVSGPCCRGVRLKACTALPCKWPTNQRPTPLATSLAKR